MVERAIFEPQCAPDERLQIVLGGDCRAVDPPYPVRMRGDPRARALERDSRLADPAGPGETEEAFLDGRFGDTRKIIVPSDEPAARDGQIRRQRSRVGPKRPLVGTFQAGSGQRMHRKSLFELPVDRDRADAVSGAQQCVDEVRRNIG